jgi:uncharacterized protein
MDMTHKNKIHVYGKATIPLIGLFLVCFILPAGCTGNNSGSGNRDPVKFVSDRAAVLTKAEKTHITGLARALLRDMDIHIMVVVLKESPEHIDKKAVEIFEDYEIGRTTHGAKGVLFLIDPPGKQVRIEIGYDLEPIFTDGFTGYIERKQMTPFFQANKIGPGIEATVELLVGRALGKTEISNNSGTKDNQQTGQFLSGGGGARVTVDMGSKTIENKASPPANQYSALPSVKETFEKYKEVLRLHIKDPHLGIYTPESRKFLSRWVVTDAQQDNELRCINRAMSTAKVFTKGKLAVISFSPDYREASPFFLEKGSRGWMIDFASMTELIGFNHKNQWHLRKKNHKYMFGFKDVYVDKNGFAHKK